MFMFSHTNECAEQSADTILGGWKQLIDIFLLHILIALVELREEKKMNVVTLVAPTISSSP